MYLFLATSTIRFNKIRPLVGSQSLVSIMPVYHTFEFQFGGFSFWVYNSPLSCPSLELILKLWIVLELWCTNPEPLHFYGTPNVFSIIIVLFFIKYKQVYHFTCIGQITVRITDPSRIVCCWYENSFMTSADAYSLEVAPTFGKVVDLYFRH